MGSFKKAIKSFTKSPFDFVKSAAKGDIGGMADALTRGVTLGSASLDSGKGVVDVKKTLETLKPQVTLPEENSAPAEKPEQQIVNAIVNAKEETRNQRRALFMTAGDELGDQVLSVVRKKRGSLFGN